MKRTILPWLALLLGGILSTGLQGQTLDEVLAKYYQARGGLEKLKALQGWKMTGTIVLPAQELQMPLAMWQKQPDKLRVETTFQGRTTVQAFDGKKAWWIVPFLAPEAREMPADQGLPFRQQADFENPLVVWKEKGYRLELLGREEADGAAAFKLRLNAPGGREILYFLDAASGLERKSAMQLAAGEGQVAVEVLYRDYRPVDGLLMPFAIENRTNGQTQMTMTIESIAIDPDMPDDLFAMPAAKEKNAGPGNESGKPAAKKEKGKKKPKK